MAATMTRRQKLHEAASKDADYLIRALQEGQVKPHELSLTQLFERLVEGGRELVDEWRHYRENSTISLHESGVQSTAFTNITGQIMVNTVMQAYQNEQFIGDQLCRTMPTRLRHGERIPGLSQIGNEAEAIGEGKPYPLVGFGEDWIETPAAVKRGMICAITREALADDLTGQILERARQVGEWIGYNREIRILQTALGITSSYKRKNNSIVATYGDNSGDHDWDNLAASNALVDWTDVEAAELLFDGMLDPNTGTPIVVNPNTIVVPTALKHTARRVLSATETRSGDITTGTGMQTVSVNPLDNYNVVTSRLVKTVTSSDSTWFLGDFPGAFAYMEVSPITTVQAPSNSHDEFHRDVVFQYKTSEWGAPAVLEPRKVVKCTG